MKTPEERARECVENRKWVKWEEWNGEWIFDPNAARTDIAAEIRAAVRDAVRECERLVSEKAFPECDTIGGLTCHEKRLFSGGCHALSQEAVRAAFPWCFEEEG